MEQSKNVRLMTFVLSALLAFCMMGCVRVAETRSNLGSVPPPEIEPAVTPDYLEAFQLLQDS